VLSLFPLFFFDSYRRHLVVVVEILREASLLVLQAAVAPVGRIRDYRFVFQRSALPCLSSGEYSAALFETRICFSICVGHLLFLLASRRPSLPWFYAPAT